MIGYMSRSILKKKIRKRALDKRIIVDQDVFGEITQHGHQALRELNRTRD